MLFHLVSTNLLHHADVSGRQLRLGGDGQLEQVPAALPVRRHPDLHRLRARM